MNFTKIPCAIMDFTNRNIKYYWSTNFVWNKNIIVYLNTIDEFKNKSIDIKKWKKWKLVLFKHKKQSYGQSKLLFVYKILKIISSVILYGKNKNK